MSDPSSESASKLSPWQTRGLIFLVLVVIGVGYLFIPPAWAPWIYFTGGSFHAAPWWSGAGTFEGPDGTYQLYFSLGPMGTGSHPTLRTPLDGDGHLCMPSGKRLMLHVEADMDKHLPLNTIGKTIDITSYSPNKPGTFSELIAAGSPFVRLTGVWGQGKIEAQGILDHQAPAPGHPAPPKPVPITVTLQQSGSWWSPSCRAH